VQIQRVVRKRIRYQSQTADLRADVNAALAVQVGGCSSKAEATSRKRVVQRSGKGTRTQPG